MKLIYSFFAVAVTFAISAMPVASETTIRATGLVSTHKFHTALEKQFYAGLEDKQVLIWQ